MCPPVRVINHSLKLKNNLQVQADKPWYKFSYEQLTKNINRKISIIFLSISLNMCFWCSKEPSR